MIHLTFYPLSLRWYGNGLSDPARMPVKSCRFGVEAYLVLKSAISERGSENC